MTDADKKEECQDLKHMLSNGDNSNTKQSQSKTSINNFENQKMSANTIRINQQHPRVSKAS
mgnify:CR=1 FL=1